jgi:uncharacterized damage-inducible protein DinB
MFEGLVKLPPDAPAAEGGGFGSMIFTLNHNYVVDLIFKGHLEGKPHGFSARNTKAMPSLHTLATNQSALDTWYVRYADDLTESLHDEVLHFEFVGGGAGAMTRGDMILHVVNHMTYHRGMAGEMFNRLKTRAPRMDLTIFLRDAPPGLPT